MGQSETQSLTRICSLFGVARQLWCKLLNFAGIICGDVCLISNVMELNSPRSKPQAEYDLVGLEISVQEKC